MSEPKLKKMREYLIDNLKKGFIRPSNAAFSSPVLFVKKPKGGLRFCIDYQELNRLTKKDRYPLLLIIETLDRLRNATLFTKLDVCHAFYRILMDPDSTTLLLYDRRLVVPKEPDNLRTRLLRQIYNSISTAHPGRTKTIQFL
ncbi:unnamed protein product [Diplocarpon coronariae]